MDSFITNGSGGSTSSRRLIAVSCLATVAALFLIQVVHAQNQSNTSGTIVTSSDGAGSSFLQNFSYGINADFTSPAVQASLNQAALGLNRKLASGSVIVSPLASTGDISVPAIAAQANVLCIAAGIETNAECLGDLVARLIHSGAGNASVRDLIRSLSGLTADNHVDAGKFAASLEAHNHFVRRASDRFLENPPEEFTVIHEVLSLLTNAAFNSQSQDK